MRTLAVAALLLAAPAAAQVRPQTGEGDPRIQVVDYHADQVVQLAVAPGYLLTIQFAPDEQIETVALGEGSGWQASANARRDYLFVKATGAVSPTNMTVVTSVRLYSFDLGAGGAGDMAYTLRFRYPTAASAETAAAPPPDFPPGGGWRVSGARALRPARISDDGAHIYLAWPRDRALPAVYAVDDQGGEALVNGAMRDDLFVIDGVVRRLAFRIDRQVARAERLPPRRRR